MKNLTAHNDGHGFATLTEWQTDGNVSRNLGTLAEVKLHNDGVLTFTVRGWRVHVASNGDLVVLGAGQGDTLNVERTELPDGGDRLVITNPGS